MTGHPDNETRQWVRCASCGHVWDEADPDSEVCACLDKYGSRVVFRFETDPFAVGAVGGGEGEA